MEANLLIDVRYAAAGSGSVLALLGVTLECSLIPWRGGEEGGGVSWGWAYLSPSPNKMGLSRYEVVVSYYNYYYYYYC